MTDQATGERDPNERKTLEDALRVAAHTVDRAANGATVDADQHALAAGFLVLCGDMAAMLDAAKQATHFCGWCQRANSDSRIGLATYTLDEVREHTQRCEHNPLVARIQQLRGALDEAFDAWLAWMTAEGRGPQPQHDRIAELRKLVQP